MKINILSRKLIKPCRPTPEKLRKYKISYLDELNPTMNAFAIVYYESGPAKGSTEYLEESLAQILPEFYPLAGRYMKETKTVECNDEGAEYIEALVDCKLVELIGGVVIPDQLNLLLPCEVTRADEYTDPILAVQINRFKCGGIAIGVSISHKLSDGASVGTFLQAWANASAGGHKPAIRPDFSCSFLFPAQNLEMPDYGSKMVKEESPNKIVARRVTFSKNEISRLKDQVGLDNAGKPPSRIQVVSALIMEAIMRVDRLQNGCLRPCAVAQAINVRERTIPPLSKYSFGNIVGLTVSECNNNMGFKDLVCLLRDDIKKGVEESAQIFTSPEIGRKILVDPEAQSIERYLRDECVVWFTDWSKFPFYEADFGWGKPIWASMANAYFDNLVIMFRNKDDDGIEAWVHLTEKYMASFEQDEEIKKYTMFKEQISKI